MDDFSSSNAPETPTAGFQDVFDAVKVMHGKLRDREGDPAELSQEAALFLSRRALDLEAVQGNLPWVPLLAMRVATLTSRPGVKLPKNVGAQFGHLLTEFFIHTRSATRHAPVDLKTAAFNDCAGAIGAAMKINGTAAPGTFPFATLTRHGLETSMKLLHESELKLVQSQSLLHLLQGSNSLRGSGVQFGRMQVGSHGLLPIKPKRDMETKLMKCTEARELLALLFEKSSTAIGGEKRQERDGFTTIDALRTLGTMGDAGFYHNDLLNNCCEMVEMTGGAAMRPHHYVGVLYNLGMLGHRTPQMQKGFLRRVNPAALASPDLVLDLLQAMAMLRQSPSNDKAEKELLNRVMAFGMRGDDNRPESQWYIGTAHSLHELGIRHHKFALIAARRIRRGIHHFSEEEAMKVLFALGGEITHDIPQNLRESWDNKVTKVVNAVVKRSERFDEDMPAMDIATLSQALKEAGVVQHKFIPDFSGGDAGAALRKLRTVGGVVENNDTASYGADSSGMSESQKTELEMSIKVKGIPSDELAAFVEEQSKKELAQHRKALIGALHLRMGEFSGVDALRILEHLDKHTVTTYYAEPLKALAGQLVAQCGELYVMEMQRAIGVLEKHKLPGRQLLAEEAFSRLQPVPPVS